MCTTSSCGRFVCLHYISHVLLLLFPGDLSMKLSLLESRRLSLKVEKQRQKLWSPK